MAPGFKLKAYAISVNIEQVRTNRNTKSTTYSASLDPIPACQMTEKGGILIVHLKAQSHQVRILSLRKQHAENTTKLYIIHWESMK